MFRISLINEVEMNEPKRHHYLPKFYLKNFCENDFLWVYDRYNNKYRQQTPINTAVKKKYYTATGIDGIPHNEVETVLANIESKAKHIIEKIDRKKSIDLEEKCILAIFIAFLYVRVPEFEMEINELTEKFLKRNNKLAIPNEKEAEIIIKQFANTKDQENLSPKKMLDFVRNENYRIKFSREHSLSLMYSLASELPLIFIQMDWQFWYSSKNSLFITSDNPLVVARPQNYNGPYGIGTKGAKKLVPLNQKVCLVMCDKGESVINRQVSSKDVRSINGLIALECNRFLISKDKSLLERLVKISKINKWRKKSRVQLL